ncbi:MAG: GNAT family N-acetyltransferase [Clostridia bacterium]|nr:GNAT family N-acetyltransferase [Clostridia bacterium]
MIIRPFEEKDKENVRFICLNSEGPCRMTPDESHYILTTYCNYYIENEGHNCFVAADEDDKAIGYIICTENFDNFRETFLRDYVPRLDEKLIIWGFNARDGAKSSFRLQEKYKEEYPAHLHIDVLPEYHRRGLGHMLTDTLKKHLKEKGIRGVMLTVGAQNKVGQSFYNKYGFDFIEKSGDDIAFGLKFDV